MRFSFLLLLWALFAFACDDDGPEPQSPDENTDRDIRQYMPLHKGSEYLYRIDSVNYLQLPYDTVVYWQKEVIGDTVRSANEQTFQEISIYQKFSWNAEWKKVRIDLARNVDDRFERQSENVLFTPIKYPITSNAVWRAAPSNDIELLYGRGVSFDNAFYKNIHQTDFVGERGFDSTVTVIQYERYDIIDRFNYREKYAKDIGLYTKVELNINYQDPNPQGGTDTAAYEPVLGYERKQRLIDYYITTE